MKWYAFLLFGMISCALQTLYAQDNGKNHAFTHADTLRGTITPERAWWDVIHYGIKITPHFDQKTTNGTNEIVFRVLKPGKLMQIDLQEPMMITNIRWGREHLKYIRDGNIFLVRFPKLLETGQIEKLVISFNGSPRIAVHPPWDGGWIFTKDKMGRPWMTVACQGLGASVWFPCKDHQSDEPDSGCTLSITVPDSLVAVGNGRLKQTLRSDNSTTTYTWSVTNPINNYDIIPYIGKYVTWHDVYHGEKGNLDCDFWVLDYNLTKAKAQFKEADSMLRCFEYWMGPYPFYEDGYKLVEAPHLGMEHQSAVAYGNRFANGYLGRDLSGTGWGLKWDFIIVHESGHEWFGNNITSNDLADMWIHEGFTNYSETLYTTCASGVEAGNDYCIGTRKNILNNKPIIARYGVNEEGSADMYYKGGNMLHMIRQIIDDDEHFRQIWRGLNKTFYHKTVNTSQVESYISQQAGKDFSKIFDQYLRTTQIPTLEYKIQQDTLSFRWTNCIPGFNMPLKVNAGTTLWIEPTTSWKSLQLKTPGDSTFSVDRNFYVHVSKL